MTNFEKLADLGRERFLSYDAVQLCRRLSLPCRNASIAVEYCGEQFLIDRAAGTVADENGVPATPDIMLTVYDYLCHTDVPILLSGVYTATGALPGAGQSNPGEADLYRETAKLFDENFDALCAAVSHRRKEQFPVGDCAAVLSVFPGFPAVLQFWRGDEEFPPQLRFLWDRSALRYFHFETLFYMMSHILCLLTEDMKKGCT